MARGSLPWLILAAVLCTLFALGVDGVLIKPPTSALMGTDVWQTNHSQYSYAGKQMVGKFVKNISFIFVTGIWVGVLIAARRVA